MSQDNEKAISRRGFVLGAGAAAVGAGLAVQTALPWGREESAAGSEWMQVKAGSLDALREAYAAELERFATTLRPRFEAGELRAAADEDGGCAWYENPQGKTEALASVHFGLEVETDTGHPSSASVFDGDSAMAYLILAASPHAASEEGAGSYHPCYTATGAVAWDVIALARARGWYVPTADESPDPLDDARAA